MSGRPRCVAEGAWLAAGGAEVTGLFCLPRGPAGRRPSSRGQEASALPPRLLCAARPYCPPSPLGGTAIGSAPPISPSVVLAGGVELALFAPPSARPPPAPERCSPSASWPSPLLQTARLPTPGFHLPTNSAPPLSGDLEGWPRGSVWETQAGIPTPRCPGSLLDDLGPVPRSRPNLLHGDSRVSPSEAVQKSKSPEAP